MRERTLSDDSGMPTALIEQARRRGDLSVLDSVDPAAVLVDFPVRSEWTAQTGFTRFVLLREGVAATRYALIR